MDSKEFVNIFFKKIKVIKNIADYLYRGTYNFTLSQGISMDGISSEIVAQSIEAVNQIMKVAQAQTIEIAQKMISMTAEIKVGVEEGKGELIDILV